MADSYEALGHEGHTYTRAPQKIHELPTPEQRLQALEAATIAVAAIIGTPAVRRIPFGAQVYVAFAMTKHQAAAHQHSNLLLSRGELLPLQLP